MVLHFEVKQWGKIKKLAQKHGNKVFDIRGSIGIFSRVLSGLSTGGMLVVSNDMHQL